MPVSEWAIVRPAHFNESGVYTTRCRLGRPKVIYRYATFEEVIENAPGNFYMRSRFLLRRLQEGCPLLPSKSDPGQPREAAEAGPGAASVRAWSLDVVDHQHFNLAFACLQPEPKLFL